MKSSQLYLITDIRCSKIRTESFDIILNIFLNRLLFLGLSFHKSFGKIIWRKWVGIDIKFIFLNYTLMRRIDRTLTVIFSESLTDFLESTKIGGDITAFNTFGGVSSLTWRKTHITRWNFTPYPELGTMYDLYYLIVIWCGAKLQGLEYSFSIN